MTRETFDNGMKRFFAVFRDNIDADNSVQGEWFDLLQDLEDIRFTFAVDEICKNQPYFGKTQNFVALIREYSKHYIAPDKKQYSFGHSDEYWRTKVAKFKKDLKENKGIDCDSLGKTEREKCINYVRMTLKDKESIFDIIDNMGG